MKTSKFTEAQIALLKQAEPGTTVRKQGVSEATFAQCGKPQTMKVGNGSEFIS